MQKRILSKQLVLGLVVFFLGLSITLILIGFQVRISKLLLNMTLQNISEVKEFYAESLRSKFNDQFSILKILADYFTDTDITDAQAIKNKGVGTAEAGGFKYIALANKDGITTDLAGHSHPNIKNKQYFLDTIGKNEPKVSNGIELDVNLEPTLTLATPFTAKNSEPAISIGVLSYNVLKQIFSTSAFSGESYTYVIAEDGNIILCNKDRNRIIYNVNFYDYISKSSGQENPELQNLELDILNGKSGHISVDGKESKKIFSYTPLGINGWYIICVVPYSYIEDQISQINLLVYILLGAVITAILLYIFITYILSKHNLDIEKANERLTIANNQAQTLIFEYDVQKNLVEFSGDTQFILGTERKSCSLDFIKSECFNRIHKEDQNILEYLKNSLAQKKKSFSAEFRYKSFTNKYFWVKMTGSTVISDDGKLKNFIGSITNVNSQILHEQELKNLAERDRLSYLLNKNAMEQKVRSYLEKEGKDCISALFIVDLDNFKDVNDNLGHMTGDLAIKDAAKKISLIFSDKDYLSRFGGDEFCILMRFDSKVSEESALKIITVKANDLAENLREDYFNNELSVDVSASIGIAMYPKDGSTYEELFTNADQALYEVKQHGKDGFKIC